MAANIRILAVRGVAATVARFIRPLIRVARLAASALRPSRTHASTGLLRVRVKNVTKPVEPPRKIAIKGGKKVIEGKASSGAG